jgi:hypothetical protein
MFETRLSETRRDQWLTASSAARTAAVAQDQPRRRSPWRRRGQTSGRTRDRRTSSRPRSLAAPSRDPRCGKRDIVVQRHLTTVVGDNRRVDPYAAIDESLQRMARSPVVLCTPPHGWPTSRQCWLLVPSFARLRSPDRSGRSRSARRSTLPTRASSASCPAAGRVRRAESPSALARDPFHDLPGQQRAHALIGRTLPWLVRVASSTLPRRSGSGEHGARRSSVFSGS